MKTLFTLPLLLLAGHAASAQQKFKHELPELGTVKTVTLSPSYGCRPPEEFKKGYEQTALFLTEFERGYDMPSLIFDGACRGGDHFWFGGSHSAIADLGEGVGVENVAPVDSATIAVDLSGLIPVEPGKPRFLDRVGVRPGHTYAALVNKRDVRGLFLFTVTEHEPAKRVTLRYLVREYKIAETARPPARAERAKATPWQ